MTEEMGGAVTTDRRWAQMMTAADVATATATTTTMTAAGTKEGE